MQPPFRCFKAYNFKLARYIWRLDFLKKMENINFQKIKGLIPAIIQEEKTGEVLMLGYMHKEALQKTIKKGFVFLWSRSRQKLWLKGEGSGNKLKVKNIFTDCDGDALLIQVKLIGKACCHAGKKSCFNKRLFCKFRGGIRPYDTR